jgi:hypothetical protein
MQFWLCLISFCPRGGAAAEMRPRAGQWAGVNPDSEMETNEVLPPCACLQSWREKTRCQPAHSTLCKV